MRAPGVGIALLVSACIGTPGLHPALHPSAPGTGTTGGIAMGVGIQKADDTTNMQIPYGEGWVRMGPGGALEIRSTPQAGFLSYEIPLTNGKTSLSLRPALGLSIFRTNDATGAMGTSEARTLMYLHPGGALVVNAGDLYVAPRFGVGIVSVLQGDGDGDTAFSGGATGGYRLGHGYTIEMSVIYSRGDDDAGNTNDAWTFLPSLGIAVP